MEWLTLYTGIKLNSTNLKQLRSGPPDKTVLKNQKEKIFQDLNIQTDHVIQARSPDIAVKEKRIRPHVAD